MENKIQSCVICASDMNHAFSSIALGKYAFDAASCPSCGFLQIVDPHWLEEAYGEAITEADTGLVARNIALSNQLTQLLYYLFGSNGRYVDFAGGTGLLVRLMRDAGFDYYWHDPYCKNIHARGFEYSASDKKYDAVTSFEALEHVREPLSFVKDALQKTNGKAFIFSTECYEISPPQQNEWWYYCFHTGQHISFFQKKTLKYMADRLNLGFVTNGSFHIYCDPDLKKRIEKYYGSRLTRKLVNFNMRKHLKSKTWSDHLLLNGSSQQDIT
jgi:hypothetical protein